MSFVKKSIVVEMERLFLKYEEFSQYDFHIIIPFDYFN